MNEHDIYELIGESFDDKVKLDFNDVKKRIADLPSKESAVIAADIPSSAGRKKIIPFIAAAAACLVCVFGLSVILGQLSSKSSESYYAADSYSAASEEMTTLAEPAYSARSDEECADAEDDYMWDYGMNDSCFSTGAFDETVLEAEEEFDDCSEEISDSDISSSDID